MSKKNTKEPKRPNILLIMADEYRFPRSFDHPDAGMKLGIKNILGFQDEKQKGKGNGLKEWGDYFPGLMKLRKNAIVLKNHTIASSACVPSRAVMFTGQYGTRTGVTQTDGILKDGQSEKFPWLDPDGIPTIGDWLRADGYETHYFGKCHFADPPHHSLQKFGFDDWEKSYPDPHGSARNNLGMYRDHGFADLVTTFLRGKGLALEYNRQAANSEEDSDKEINEKPWFAVASFTNPHDITTYPMLTASLEETINMDNIATISKSLKKLKNEIERIKETKGRPPLKIPTKNEKSVAPDHGTWQINMNPDGFPQDNADLPVTWDEDLQNNNKPDCQYEYSLKLGLAIASGIDITGDALQLANHSAELLGMPLPMTNDPADSSLKYLQYYTYLHQVVDQHIDRLISTIKETGLRDNTIVIFAPDHGEYGGAHGQMAQKWHSAYQEAIHVPVVVSLPPNSKKVKGSMRQVEELTSHIDMLPTILGLAGIDKKRRKKIAKKLKKTHDVPKLVGADLSNLIYGTQKGPLTPVNSDEPREGILFITDDMITQKLKGEKYEPYNVFLKTIDHYKTNSEKYKEMFENVQEGSICQPCHVMCVRQGDWKLVKYFDPKGNKDNQWEMYNLKDDSAENNNLLQYDGAFPTAYFPTKKGGSKMKAKKIESKAESLYKVMKKLAKEMLPPE